MIPARKGTYIIFLNSTDTGTLTAGRKGKIHIIPGTYAYVGSARGPGGLRARVGRHLRQEKSCRWHIDFLTAVLPVHTIWYHEGLENLECPWADILSRMGGQIPMKGFGASDCQCPAHLFYFNAMPQLTHFQGKTRIEIDAPVKQISL